MSKARADDLRRLPIQDCDVLLHEAGAPPIHTPLTVLQALPEHVKKRLYIVHTAAIPPDSGLRVAPTGTAGTIRLDKSKHLNNNRVIESAADPQKKRGDSVDSITIDNLQDGATQNITVYGDFSASLTKQMLEKFSNEIETAKVAPLVFTRPTDVSDSWFILNLLSAVPFLTSLSYSHTMEVLEIANVQMFCLGETVIEGGQRPDLLCVFWEGACKEVVPNNGNGTENDMERPCVWHAGDWTGPVSLQPDTNRCSRVIPGESLPRDIVAISEEGVKVIILSIKDLYRILKIGSKLFRKYMSLEGKRQGKVEDSFLQNPLDESNDTLMDAIQYNSVLGSLYPMQMRHLESLAEGPRYFSPNSLMWKVGDPVDFAFVILEGTATLGKKAERSRSSQRMTRRGSTGAISDDVLMSIEEQGRRERESQFSPMVSVEADKLLQNVQPNSEYARLETVLQIRMEELDSSPHRDKFANKVLARLYSRRAYTKDLIFSRGNFLCDTSRMVSGDLANISKSTMWASRNSMGSGGTPSDHHFHTSNMIAGHEGCVAFVFPRSSLVPFFDSNPGVLLSLLGTQVVI